MPFILNGTLQTHLRTRQQKYDAVVAEGGALLHRVRSLEGSVARLESEVADLERLAKRRDDLDTKLIVLYNEVFLGGDAEVEEGQAQSALFALQLELKEVSEAERKRPCSEHS